MYNYQAERPKLFTEAGQDVFLAYRDAAQRLLAKAGAFRFSELCTEARTGGDSWFQIACVDRLVELGELREVTTDAPGQHRVFVAGRQ